MKKYILYVKKYNILINDYEMVAYIAETEDILHTMGEIYFRTLEAIKRIDFIPYKESSIKFCQEKNIKIFEWQNKYKIGDKRL